MNEAELALMLEDVTTIEGAFVEVEDLAAGRENIEDVVEVPVQKINPAEGYHGHLVPIKSIETATETRAAEVPV